MEKIEKSIDVECPINKVYNQWTQFEEFPRFMEGVKSVTQLDDKRLHWVAEVSGKRKDWDARITRQVPDEVISWVSEGGTTNNGTVIFRPKDGTKTEVELHLEVTPEDLKEQVGGATGVVSRQVEGDLKRFKEFIEHQPAPTGKWSGEIRSGQVKN